MYQSVEYNAKITLLSWVPTGLVASVNEASSSAIEQKSAYDSKKLLLLNLVNKYSCLLNFKRTHQQDKLFGFERFATPKSSYLQLKIFSDENS